MCSLLPAHTGYRCTSESTESSAISIRSQSFEVVSIRPEPTLPGTSQQVRIAFSRQVDEMRRAVGGTLSSIDEIQAQLGAIKETLQNSTADMALYAASQFNRPAFERAA